MDAKTKISQYRERLDKTLASSDLTDENVIRTSVESRMLKSPEYVTKGDIGTLSKKKTTELVDLLGMLRSASLNNDRNTSPSGQLNAEWKVKQDTEECRVMYREGPPGTPFHMLLVEGYLDGPVDACLCVAWETTLYKKWWPQFNYPAFKITSSQCIHEIGIGEKICTVRVKVPWPLSAREALLHYYEFECFQEDLVVVYIKSIDNAERDGSLYGLLPESNNVVRIGIVGGLAIQKVNNDRCYFRFIASLDMKLDFVSPSLINFIARQLIGNGFKLCQKAVASISKGNKDFKEALEGPMYDRIRLANHMTETIQVLEPEIIKADEGNSTLEDDSLIKKIQFDGNGTERDVFESKMGTSKINIPLKSLDGKSALNGVSEIEEEDDSIARASQFRATGMYGKKMHIRTEVEQALCTLDRVIEASRELRMDKDISSNARPDATSRDMKSGVTAGEVNTSMFKQISTTGEITTRPVLMTNDLAIVGSTSKVNNGVYESMVEKAKVGRPRNRNTCCLCWSCSLRHR